MKMRVYNIAVDNPLIDDTTLVEDTVKIFDRIAKAGMIREVSYEYSGDAADEYVDIEFTLKD